MTATTATTNALINETEAARRLALTVFALRAWRIQGKGPPYCKIGSRVRYDPDTLEAYIKSSVVTPGAKDRKTIGRDG
jgi:hypothetical protein